MSAQAEQHQQGDTFSLVYKFFSDGGFDKVLYSSSWDKYLERMIVHLEHSRKVRKLPEKDVTYLRDFVAKADKLFPNQDWFDYPSKYEKIKQALNEEKRKKSEHIPEEYSC